MAEQIGEGFFVGQSSIKDIREGREILAENKEMIEDAKGLRELAETMLDFEDISEEQKQKLEAEIAHYDSKIEEYKKSREEIAELYDRLYKAVYGVLPN